MAEPDPRFGEFKAQIMTLDWSVTFEYVVQKELEITSVTNESHPHIMKAGNNQDKLGVYYGLKDPFEVNFIDDYNSKFGQFLHIKFQKCQQDCVTDQEEID